MNINEIISADKDVLATRVAVETLFDHLESGISIDEFLEDFPTVNREQAIGLLNIANRILTIKNIDQIYEALTG